MQYFQKYIFIIIGVFLFASCDEEDNLIEEQIANSPLPMGNPGSLDLTTYVSLGNSLTAGLMDGALYTDGQDKSFPNLLAKQFQSVGVGGGAFNQPNIGSDVGVNLLISDIPSGVIIGRSFLNTTVLAPEFIVPGEVFGAFSGDKSQLNNFGVPGLFTGQLLTPETGTPGSSIENPYYTRFASAPGTSTVLGDAIARNPTFFSLWIGNNDVLGYATSGGANTTVLTSGEAFEQQYNAVIASLIGNTSANGVVLNIPGTLLAIPFFQAIPYNAIPFDTSDPVQAGTVDFLNSVNAYGGFNLALQGLAAAGAISLEEATRRSVSFGNGANPIVVTDDSMTDLGPLLSSINPALAGFGQIRQLAAGELVLLSAGATLGQSLVPGDPTTVVGVAVPLGDQFVLTIDELATIQQSLISFNTTIATAVAQNSGRLVLYDTNDPTSIFADLYGLSDGVLGVNVNGVNLQPDFSPNGIFSTDGIHPNPKGNALIANDVIRVLNTNFNASIPEVDVDALRSVVFQ